MVAHIKVIHFEHNKHKAVSTKQYQRNFEKHGINVLYSNYNTRTYIQMHCTLKVMYTTFHMDSILHTLSLAKAIDIHPTQSILYTLSICAAFVSFKNIQKTKYPENKTTYIHKTNRRRKIKKKCVCIQKVFFLFCVCLCARYMSFVACEWTQVHYSFNFYI